MNNEEKVVCFVESDLSSRSSSAGKRLQVQSLIQLFGRVTLDFKNVRAISDSYADELFGVLVLENDAEWLFDHVTVVNARRPVLHKVATVIRRRLNDLQEVGHTNTGLAAV